MHYSDYKKQQNYILLTTFILKGEIRLFGLDSIDYFSSFFGPLMCRNSCDFES